MKYLMSWLVIMKNLVKRLVPEGLWARMRSLKWVLLDIPPILQFLTNSTLGISAADRVRFIRRILEVHRKVDCPHTNAEILAFVTRIFELGPNMEAAFVEAGCFKGGSSAKFSIACAMVGRQLILCDSFQGIPSNSEEHGKTIFGSDAEFPEGSYVGTLDEVKRNIKTYGEIGVCEFIEGFFDETLPDFDRPVAAAYIDVDLASSTRSCIRYLYPNIQKGGYILSQDGHLPLVIKTFEDETLWQDELGVPKPEIKGLWKSKIIELQVS